MFDVHSFPGFIFGTANTKDDFEAAINKAVSDFNRMYDVNEKQVHLPMRNSPRGVNCVSIPRPTKIISNPPTTVVFFDDGSKQIVHCPPDVEFNEYNAFVSALAIKIFGSNSALKKFIAENTFTDNKKTKEQIRAKKREEIEKEFDRLQTEIDNLSKQYEALNDDLR